MSATAWRSSAADGWSPWRTSRASWSGGSGTSSCGSPATTCRPWRACAGSARIGRTADGRITCQLEGDVGPFLAAIAGHQVIDLTIEPAHLEEAFLELYEDAEPEGDEPVRAAPPAARRAGGGPMSRTLFGHLWRSQRTKLLVVCVAMVAWSTFLPVIYQSFGQQMQALVDSGVIPKQLTNFGGGDVFSLAGSVALGYIHPISIILVSIFAIGFSASAVAGERQRGSKRLRAWRVETSPRGRTRRAQSCKS